MVLVMCCLAVCKCEDLMSELGLRGMTMNGSGFGAHYPYPLPLSTALLAFL